MHPIEDIRGSKGTDLSGKKIVVGITGSIAAVENVKLLRELARYGANVIPVMTKAAERIVHKDAIWFATGKRPITALTGDVEHVMHCGEVPDRADLFLICPATANTIGKIAHGIDDTPVTTFATTAIGSGIPVMIVPAMHGSMYKHPVVHENIEKLRKMGVVFVDPRLEENKAKVASIARVTNEVMRALSEKVLDGKRVTVIYGGTKEPLDDVRYLGNRSSGKTGCELARRAYVEGAIVTTIRAEDAPFPEIIAEEITFQSHADLLEIMERHESDLFIVPAAISDFGVEKEKGKMGSSATVEVTLKPLEKVIGKMRGNVIPFKAQSGLSDDALVAKGRLLLTENVLFVVANDIRNVRKSSGRFIFVTEDDSDPFEGTKEKMAKETIWRASKCLEK